MDAANRVSRVVPKVRQVGFVTPNPPPANPPPRSLSCPPDSNSQPLSDSPAGNSLSPIMIPPPLRRLSGNFNSRTDAVSVPGRPAPREHITVGSYNPSESVLGLDSPQSRMSDGDLSEGTDSTVGFFRRSNSAKFASSLPSGGGGFDLFPVKQSDNVTELNWKESDQTPERSVGIVETVQPEQPPSSKPAKTETTKAERRALQESQRAAKAASRADTSKSAAASVGPGPGKPVKQPQQKKDRPPVASSVAASENKGTDRSTDKEKKKDVPPPRMQFDDKTRVDKAKKRAVVNQTEARNRVEFFRHLPQYEHGNQLRDLESKFFEFDHIHPAVYKVGLQFLAGEISGGNARCITMLESFREAISCYTTPPEKTLNRDLTAKISSYISFIIECRPLSMSMGNAIRFLKTRIAKLSPNLPDSEAKAVLCSDIDRLISEKILVADKVIVNQAVTKIRDGDVLLTYGSSCVVEMIFLRAYELGKQFRVVLVDSRPELEGQKLLRLLVSRGLRCTYTHINAISYNMHEVTRVFLGASAILANGSVFSRVGTACVAMVAHAFRIPVLICCEAYKFHERVQLDSICFNELGDPDDLVRVPGRPDVNYLDNCSAKANLQLLNLKYDTTPSDYISMIITDYGMVPPTSVPVIVREHLLM